MAAAAAAEAVPLSVAMAAAASAGSSSLLASRIASILSLRLLRVGASLDAASLDVSADTSSVVVGCQDCRRCRPALPGTRGGLLADELGSSESALAAAAPPPPPAAALSDLLGPKWASTWAADGMWLVCPHIPGLDAPGILPTPLSLLALPGAAALGVPLLSAAPFGRPAPELVRGTDTDAAAAAAAAANAAAAPLAMRVGALVAPEVAPAALGEPWLLPVPPLLPQVPDPLMRGEAVPLPGARGLVGPNRILSMKAASPAGGVLTRGVGGALRDAPPLALLLVLDGLLGVWARRGLPPAALAGLRAELVRVGLPCGGTYAPALLPDIAAAAAAAAAEVVRMAGRDGSGRSLLWGVGV